MPRLSDEQLDALLGEHFGWELAAQEGRTVGHFLKMASPRSRGWRPVVRWSAGIAAGALAACIAIVVMHGRIGEWFGGRPGMQATSQPATIVAPPVTVSVNTPLRREQTVEWSTLDEGAVAGVDGGPLRQLRRVELQRVRLIDAKGKTVFETTIPRERVMLIQARTY
ncbi:MAG: hypothetical protein ABSH20_24525 [Tepidisphaeraceae bacterium]|jgi:hypothetical protein